MKLLKSASAMMICAALVACANPRGRPKVISHDGYPLTQRSLPDDARAGLYTEFRVAAEAAYGGTHVQPTSSDRLPSADPAVLKRFLDSGLAVIHVTCSAYLEGKADRQRDVNVWRDSFAPITALLGGLYTLRSKKDAVDSDTLTGLALITTAATAGFEIYEERFLFGAKNVDNVRELVLTAQMEHAKKVLAVQNPSYNQVVLSLHENQMVCSPGKILDMVSKAIAENKIEAVPRNSETEDQDAPSEDAQLIQALIDEEKLTQADVDAAREKLKSNPDAVNALVEPEGTTSSLQSFEIVIE